MCVLCLSCVDCGDRQSESVSVYHTKPILAHVDPSLNSNLEMNVKQGFFFFLTACKTLMWSVKFTVCTFNEMRKCNLLHMEDLSGVFTSFLEPMIKFLNYLSSAFLVTFCSVSLLVFHSRICNRAMEFYFHSRGRR